MWLRHATVLTHSIELHKNETGSFRWLKYAARLPIDHFTGVGLATWPLNGSEAVVNLVLIQTSYWPHYFHCTNQVVLMLTSLHLNDKAKGETEPLQPWLLLRSFHNHRLHFFWFLKFKETTTKTTSCTTNITDVEKTAKIFQHPHRHLTQVPK